MATNEKKAAPKRIPTPTSTTLRAVVQRYSAWNDALERSLNESEDRIPTKHAVKERLEAAGKRAR